VLLQQRKKQLLYGVLDILYGTFWCCICHEHPASRGTKHYAQLKSNKKILVGFFGTFLGTGREMQTCKPCSTSPQGSSDIDRNYSYGSCSDEERREPQ
jgi:hypothetical protein